MTTTKRAFSAAAAAWGMTLLAAGGTNHTVQAQPAQETLFCGNNVSGNVSVYTVNPDGTLTQIPGSPFSAGTNPQAVSLTADGRLLAVVNATASTVEELRVFSVGPTGALTEAPGSPYLVGDGPLGMDIGGPPGIEFCIVPSASSDRIHVFSISGLTLTEVPGSPFLTGDFPVEADVSPDGQYLFVSLISSAVAAYSIGPTGTLTAVPGSPFPVTRNAFELLVSPDGQNLYVGTGLHNAVEAFDIAPNGSLTLVPGSPFPSGGTSAVNLAMRPERDFLFVANVVSDTVTSMARGPTGTVSFVPGSSVLIGNDVRKLACDSDYLFVTDESSLGGQVGILSYRINPDGTLTRVPGSPFPAGSRPQDMVLFVPPACAGADFDGDGDVDLSDFVFFQLCFAGSNNPFPPGCECADLDGDGDVDLADFILFQQAFTGSF